MITHPGLRRAMAKLVASVGLLVLWTGCGTRPPAPGLPAGSTSRYPRLLVVPLLSDRLRVEWNDGIEPPLVSHASVDWKTPDKAVQIVTELFSGGGAHVRAVTDVTEPASEEREERRWAAPLGRQLHASGEMQNDEVALLIRQNAIDAYGRQYSPLRLFLQAGVLGVLVGTAKRGDLYEPGFVLAINTGLHAAMVGPSHCSIGLDAALVEGRASRPIAEVSGVLGREFVPDRIRAQRWKDFGPAERSTVEIYCTAALRRAISQAASRLRMAAAKHGPDS